MRLISSFFIVILLLFGSCKTETKQALKTETIHFTKEGLLTVSRANVDTINARFNIEIAESDYETQTGLMYRNSMEDNQGMLFIFPDVAMHSFYMKNTVIPLDIIYIDENLRIVSFQKNAKPFDETGLSSKVPVKYVFEINAGLSEKLGLEIGDLISYTKD